MSAELKRQRIVVIIGPTAGGKSDLAVAVAKQFNGEIINADSMQIYKHLNAGTAKPTPQQLAAAPHHMIDIVEPTDSFSAADWLQGSEHLIHELQAHGSLPVIAGGTNLYIKALLEGMFDGPAADEEFRRSLDQVHEHELHAKLVKVDPEAALRIEMNDRKRLIRALEVFQVSGKRITDLQKQWSEERDRTYRHDPILIGLRWEVEEINRRINARVKQMFYPEDGREGLIDETRRLLNAGLLGHQAKQAIGTKQVLEHFEGHLDADEAFERVKIVTRRFARAQRTWLKRYRGVNWLDATQENWPHPIEQAMRVLTTELGK